jgi:hypothetical protein
MLTSEITRVVVLYKISYSGYRCLSKDPTNGVLTTGQEQELVNTTSVEFRSLVALGARTAPQGTLRSSPSSGA